MRAADRCSSWSLIPEQPRAAHLAGVAWWACLPAVPMGHLTATMPDCGVR